MDSKQAVALISCAKDTCSGFAGNLFQSLKISGYCAKVASDDHQELKADELKRFKIFIIVLSHHYATCPSRLGKLVEIVDKFGKTERRRVLPVFFDVVPYDVRNQKASFEIAFDVYENYVEPETLKEWREALDWVGSRNGWHFKKSGNTYEYTLVEEITQIISIVVPCTVGLSLRVETVDDRLKSESDGKVGIVGIYGEVGIGKTTIAREVCHSNSFGEFDHYCFLDRAGETLEMSRLVGLIKELLLQIGGFLLKIGGKNEVESGVEAMSILKQQVGQKKLFVVFEDILDEHQLQDIVDVINCLGSKSKVIITAVDNYFQQYPQINLYEEKGLEEDEVYTLLCLKAFDLKGFSDWDAVGVLKQASSTLACRVPIILEVIGSYLRGKESSTWTSILDQYKGIKDEQKQRILQMSFDDLNGNQKKYLIAIADALDKKQFSKVEYLRQELEYDIKVLIGKSLIKINEHDLVTMNHLTQNMVKAKSQLSEEN